MINKNYSSARVVTGASWGPTHIPRNSQVREQTFLQQGSPVQELVQGTGITARQKWRFLPGLVSQRLSTQETHCFYLGESSCGQAMPWQGMDANTHTQGAAKAFLGTTLRERHSSPWKLIMWRGASKSHGEGRWTLAAASLYGFGSTLLEESSLSN